MSKESALSFYDVVKRLLDIFASLFFLIVLSPVYVAAALSIFLQDGGEPIYVQKRVGEGRKEFNFIKFRSMVKNADAILFSDAAMYKSVRSGTHKIKNDPRITKVGKFIRKYSIDELPQFVNVLKGEMSFVGPRALRPDELLKFEREHPKAIGYIEDMLSVKPGITGIWQVSGRSKIGFLDRVKMDASYARTGSILLDLWIIIRTPLAVLKGEGAE